MYTTAIVCWIYVDSLLSMHNQVCPAQINTCSLLMSNLYGAHSYFCQVDITTFVTEERNIIYKRNKTQHKRIIVATTVITKMKIRG